MECCHLNLQYILSKNCFGKICIRYAVWYLLTFIFFDKSGREAFGIHGKGKNCSPFSGGVKGKGTKQPRWAGGKVLMMALDICSSLCFSKTFHCFKVLSNGLIFSASWGSLGRMLFVPAFIDLETETWIGCDSPKTMLSWGGELGFSTQVFPL